MIQFHANRRSAFCVSDDRLTTGSVGLETVFRFSEEWKAAPARVAVFRGSGRSVDVLLTGERCSVPPEVLTEAGGVLSIGVYGTDGNGTVVIPTVYDEVGSIERGTAPSGIEPEEQTQPLIDQLLTAAQAARSSADYALLFAETLNAGDGIPLDAEWVRGDVSADMPYRAHTIRAVARAKTVLQAAAGYRFYVCIYSDGSCTNSNWYGLDYASRQTCTLPKGTDYVIVVGRSPEDTSIEADPEVFGAAITIRNNSVSGSGGVAVDDALSGSSTNPVQNRVIKAALEGKYSKPSGGIPATDLAETYLTRHQDVSGKLDKAQGAANAGKFLVVGSDGNITTVSMTAWQGGSY